MLVQLTPKQVEDRWEEYWNLMILAVGNKETMDPQKIRQAVKEKQLLVWVYIKNDEVIGLMMTTVFFISFLNYASLFIYGVYAPENLTLADFQHCYTNIQLFAKRIGCSTINFYTSNPKFVSWANRLEALVEHHVVIPVFKEVSNG